MQHNNFNWRVILIKVFCFVFFFIWQATDGGRPTLFSTVTLNITVEDINDNKPVFNQSWYNVTVKENDPPGVVWIILLYYIMFLEQPNVDTV